MSEKWSVLLIEDSNTQAVLLTETLIEAGYAVHRVANAEDGLEYLQSHRPDLAIVDYHLPGMQGSEFCRVIRDSIATDMPLLALTDESSSQTEGYLLDHGADDYVAKSQDSDILLARIDLLLRRTHKSAPAPIDETAFYKAQRVLLVDDSPTYLAFLEHELQRDGYRIMAAESGEAAIELTRQNPIDCAVIDLVMPGMDGIAVCRKLLEMCAPGQSLPVLIVTAQGSKEKMIESLEVGADDYVEKSNDATILKARLRALLRRKLMQEEHDRIQTEIRNKEFELVQERARNEAHLRAILDNAADCVIATDDRGQITTFNKSAEQVFGYAAAEAIGRNVALLIPHETAGEHGSCLSRYLMTETSSKLTGPGPREVAAKRRDGSQFPAELSVGEIKTESEHQFVGILRDISVRKEAEEQILLYIDKLQRSNQDLDEFAYIASHDLKEPLRGLSNNAMFLKEDFEDKLDDDAKKRLDRMVYLCDRLERLVNDLLYFSRLGRQSLAIQETDLNDVVKDVEATMLATLQEKNAVIVVPTPLPAVRCDRTRVTELLRNLIVNAAKYNDKPKKQIEIGWRPMRSDDAQSSPVFYVKDDGIGIDKQYHEDVFRIFKRLNVEDSVTKGTGSGLTFVRKIVERHSGRIWIESEPGAGTTFFFTLSPSERGVSNDRTVALADH